MVCVCMYVCECVRATANGSYFRHFYAFCFGLCFVTLFGHFLVAVTAVYRCVGVCVCA